MEEWATEAMMTKMHADNDNGDSDDTAMMAAIVRGNVCDCRSCREIERGRLRYVRLAQLIRAVRR